MGSIAFIGDRSTTTTLAVAIGWAPRAGAKQDRAAHAGQDRTETAQQPSSSPLVVEVDPTGGSLAAWLDMPANPSLSTIVAQGGTITPRSLEPMVRSSPDGLAIIPAPFRSREASRAVAESCRTLLPALADDERTALLDVGRLTPADGVPPTIQGASSLVLCHRQEAASARAAAVRLERLAESVELLAHLDRPLTIALIGDEPYGGDEVIEYLLSDGSRIATPNAVPTLVTLPDDALCAAVLAGRVGVSARRLARLPLMRAARALGAQLRTAQAESPHTSPDSSPPATPRSFGGVA